MTSTLISTEKAAAVAASAAVWPWVITLTHQVREQPAATFVHILQATLAELPDAGDLLPADAALLRCDVFPATRFDDMVPAVRERYRPQYRGFLLWRKARAASKSPAALQPWVDFDPIAIDETVERWVRPAHFIAGA